MAMLALWGTPRVFVRCGCASAIFLYLRYNVGTLDPGKCSNTMNETLPTLKNTSRSDALRSSRWMDPASRTGVVSLEISHDVANDVPLDLETAHTIALSLSLKVTIAESRPAFDGDYSRVFVGRLGDEKVCLQDAIVVRLTASGGSEGPEGNKG
jgi:hypothetical protein